MSGKKDIKPTREQLGASNPRRTVWVSANAGAGKTHVLVDRVIRLMLDGAEPDTILCLTFTKAAAAEMKNRLFERLSEWTLASDAELNAGLRNLDIRISADVLIAARQLFTKALETPGGLKIQTIHAFAEKLLQLFPVEAGIAPGFKVLEDRATEDMIAAARSAVLSAAQDSADDDLSRSLDMVGEYASGDTFELLLKAVFAGRDVIHELIGGNADYASIRAFVAQTLGLDSALDTAELARRVAAIDMAAYKDAADALRDVARFGKTKLTISEQLRTVMFAQGEDDRTQELLEMYFTQTREPRKAIYSKGTAEDYQRFDQWFKVERLRVEALVSLHDLNLRADMTASLLYLGERISQEFERRKRAASAYDFSDLIARASHLVRDTAMTQWVLYKLDRAITHILVDEAQDTNPDQWKIILAIASEFYAGLGAEERTIRTLFVVGDQKQSIFSFQGADARTFQLTRDTVSAQVADANQEPPQISLLTSYRSVPEVLDFVDAVFPDAASAAMGLNPSDGERRKHYSNRKNEHGLVQVWPLIESIDPEKPDHWLVPVDQKPKGFYRRLLASKIAATIRSWVGKRTIPSLGRKVEAGDILILLQTRGLLFAMIIAELRALGIGVAGADRIKLVESLSVQDLLALAQVMLLPEDDYSLACILKSPFVPEPLDEKELFDLSYDRKQGSLRSRLFSSTDEKAIANAKYIGELQREAGIIGPFAFFSKVLSLRRKEMQARLGPESRDATSAFLDYAIDFEHEQGTSLAAFVAWFQSGEIVLKREMEKAAGQVRLMTVHGAKGLESQIVILPDAADDKSPDKVNLVYAPNGLPIWAISDLAPAPQVDEWRETKKRLALEEHKRLLYVAMTRARDELYIAGSMSRLTNKAGVEKVSDKNWYRFIKDQLAAQTDIEMQRADDPFQMEQVLHYGAWPDETELGRNQVEVQHLLPAWLLEPAPLPPVPRPWSVTRLAGQLLPVLGADPDNQAGLTFGTKVHEFFRLMPLVSSALRLRYAAEAAMRLGLDPSFARRIAMQIDEADLEPFFGAGSLAEIEILADLPSGEDLSGRIDRLRITNDFIYLLDYKTDSNPPPGLSPDMPAVQQIALYSQCVSKAYPGRKSSVAILWTANQRLDFIEPAQLTQACELALMTRQAFTA